MSPPDWMGVTAGLDGCHHRTRWVSPRDQMGAIGKDTVHDDLAHTGGAAWRTGALSGAWRLEPVPPFARLRTDDAAALRKQRSCRGHPRSLRSGFTLTLIAARPCRAPRCATRPRRNRSHVPGWKKDQATLNDRDTNLGRHRPGQSNAGTRD